MIKQDVTANGKAIGCYLGAAKSGNTQLGVHFEVTDGQYAGERVDWSGWFDEKCSERTVEAIRTMGWNGDDIDELASCNAAECAERLPNEVTLVIRMEEGTDGKEYPRVSFVNKKRELREFGKLDKSAARAFAASVKGLLLSKPGTGPAKKPAQRQPTSQDQNSGMELDELPPLGTGKDDFPF